MAETRVSEKKLQELVAGEPFSFAEFGMICRELQELRAQSSWVKVSDRLPEDDTIVLAFAGGEVRYCYFYEGGSGCCQKIFVDNLGCSEWEAGDPEITHWREIPAPPEEDK